MKTIDDEISRYCNIRKIRFTRYADDLTFSGDFNENEILNFAKECLAAFDLKVNDEKTKLMSRGERQIVTGIVVNDKLQVQFHKRNEIRNTMFYIRKFGLADHMSKLNITQSNYLPHLLGKINFILQINPSDDEFIRYKELLLAFFDNPKNENEES